MDKKKSTATGKSTGAEQAKQAPVTSKGAIRRRRMNVPMVQNVLLIWLDKNIDEDNNTDCQNTITQLRRVVNTINTFIDGDQCVEFLTTINNEKACMIISGALGQDIVPFVHNMPQVDSIFIFCGNKKWHEQWTKDWPKIKGVFTEIIPICEALKEAAHQCEHNSIAMSFMATTGGDASSKNLNQLDCSFMYTQILKEILLTIQFEQQHIQEFITHCRDVFADNDHELANVRKLERKYPNETPIWWYTYDCFLYPMLNHALRLMDVDIIIKMGFFIRDLHRHIEQLHTKQFGDHQTGQQVFTVYRGQGLSKPDFDQMMKTKGGLMSFNSFLSTSKNRHVSLDFARGALLNPDLVGILFVMTVVPSLSSTPFASINKVSYFQDQEDEVLFSMHTIFRIREIKSIGENNRLWQVDLALTSDNDEELRVLTKRIREETFPDDEGWYRLGLLLVKMGQAGKAQQVYEVILEQTSDDREKAPIYDQLGMIKRKQRENVEAITFYEKSLEIKQKMFPPDHPDLAASYNNIGNVYGQMGEYSKALSFYKKTLDIFQKTLPPTHLDLASSYNNIGVVYKQMGEYSKALSFYEKDLEISKKSLPPTHPSLAMSYDNIGLLYYKMCEYSKALPFFERAVDIAQQSLPTNHSSLQMYRRNLEVVKKKL